MNCQLQRGFSLSILFLFLSQYSTTITAQAPAQPPLPPAAKPPLPPGPPNISAILEKAGQYTILLRLMGTTQVAKQINGQLNNSNNAMTMFAPPDSAFSSLPSGVLNSLDNEQKDALVQYHMIPTFLSMSQFQTVSNPVRTQAGDSTIGSFPLNITTFGNQVNISTGIVNASLGHTIYTDNHQLAIYQVDKVLLPQSIFGPHPPAPAPSPAAPKKKKTAAAEDATPSTDDTGSSTASGAVRLSAGTAAVALVVSIGVAARACR
ncbi:fasciclin-like arabinogalactan protein 12 [Diospyros lotus]|uniref:fasciclin-like arabinogalactan protein 12 n=1 Tax=Diospyros lotus TaxID=55363 RepID=UPI00224D38C0|nr:fasciclin-like arabinogalactan protein 12 [Diospyros lotus]